MTPQRSIWGEERPASSAFWASVYIKVHTQKTVARVTPTSWKSSRARQDQKQPRTRRGQPTRRQLARTYLVHPIWTGIWLDRLWRCLRRRQWGNNTYLNHRSYRSYRSHWLSATLMLARAQTKAKSKIQESAASNTTGQQGTPCGFQRRAQNLCSLLSRRLISKFHIDNLGLQMALTRKSLISKDNPNRFLNHQITQ